MFSQKQNQKYHPKTQLNEKNLPFHDVFIISFPYIFPLRVRQRLSYKKGNSSNEGLILDQCNRKIK